MDPDSADCEFSTSGAEEVVLEKAKEHWIDIHGFEEEDFTPDVMDKIMTATKDDESDFEDEEEVV